MVGYNKVRKEFRNQIYDLLEQSKMDRDRKELDKVKKDKPSSKVNPPKNPFRYKRVGKNEYEYDFMSYDEWEKMMSESKSIGKKSVKQVLSDVISNIKDEVRMEDDYYNYDRNGFIKMLNKNDGERLELVYPTDVQTIATLIIQLSRFGEIKYYDDVDGEDLRKKYRIEE